MQHLPGQGSTAEEDDEDDVSVGGKKEKRRGSNCKLCGQKGEWDEGQVNKEDLLSLSGQLGGGSSSAFSLRLAESIKYISAKRFTATAKHIKQNASLSLLLFSPLLFFSLLFSRQGLLIFHAQLVFLSSVHIL